MAMSRLPSPVYGIATWYSTYRVRTSECPASVRQGELELNDFSPCFFVMAYWCAGVMIYCSFSCQYYTTFFSDGRRSDAVYQGIEPSIGRSENVTEWEEPGEYTRFHSHRPESAVIILLVGTLSKPYDVKATRTR